MPKQHLPECCRARDAAHFSGDDFWFAAVDPATGRSGKRVTHLANQTIAPGRPGVMDVAHGQLKAILQEGGDTGRHSLVSVDANATVVSRQPLEGAPEGVVGLAMRALGPPDRPIFGLTYAT